MSEAAIGLAGASRARPAIPRVIIALLSMGLIYLLLIGAVVYPISLVFGYVFFGSESISLSDAFALVTSSTFVTGLINSLATSFYAAVISGFFGISLAWLMARTNLPLKRVLDPLQILPFYLSSLVGALSWQVVAAPRTGLLNQLLLPIFHAPVFDIYSIAGMSLVMGLFHTPFVYLFALGSLRSMDGSLEDAARMSGSSILQTALRITLPLSAPAILSSLILSFVASLGGFGVPVILGVPANQPTLGTLMYQYVNDYPPKDGTAAFLGMTLAIVTLLLTLVQWYVMRGRRFTTISGKGYKATTIDLGRWKWAGFGLNVVYLSMVLLPFLAMAAVSFQNVWVGRIELSRFTLANYGQILINQVAQRGAVNSITIASVGATIAVIACFGLALVSQRTRLPGRQGVTAISMLPMMVPGVILGIGYLMASLRTPFYGTIWIIMIAYIVDYLPIGVRNSGALVQGISRELDESARMSGASWRTAMRTVLAPLVWPGMISLWLLLFVTFIREVSASAMLYTAGTETLSIALLHILDTASFGVAGAFGVLQTVLMLICVVAIRLVPTRGAGNL